MSRKVPFVMRMALTDSGAACLSMVLAYHGRRVPLSKTREALDPSRGGNTPEEILAAASCFRTVGRLVDPLTAAEEVGPLIVRWHWKDFLVVERRRPRGVSVIDPALGRLRVTPEEFAAGATGPAVLLEPVGDSQPQEEAPLPWRRYGRMALEQWRRLAFVFSISIVVRLLGLTMPIMVAFLVDHVIPDREIGLLYMAGLGLAVFVVVQVVTSLARQWLLIDLGIVLDHRIMAEFFERLLRQPLSFFQIRTGGGLLMHVTSNSAIRNVLSSQLLAFALDAILVVIYLALMFAFDVFLAILVTVMGVLHLGLMVLSNRVLYYYSQRSVLSQTQLQSYVLEMLNGISTVKTSGREDKALSRWRHLFRSNLTASSTQQRVGALVGSANQAVGAAGPLILLVVGASLVIDDDLTLGRMLGFNALAGAFLVPLASIGGVAQQLQIAAVHLNRLNDVFENKPEQDPDVPRRTMTLKGHVEARGISFRYGPKSPDVLKDVDLSIAPGKVLAIVGPTGSGKSTLVKILAGLYRPTEGEVSFDGIPLSELDLPSLRRQLGVVLQENFLFQESVQQNIALYDPSLSLDAVREAAAMAAIDADIERLPLGYQTHLGELGNNLSGGQRQRLCLARALAHAPPVLILDEATSHLDAATDAAIRRSLTALHSTRIVVAHRLSTIRDADQILVLNRNRIVERGTHDELMAQESFYRQLFASQTESPAKLSRARFS